MKPLLCALMVLAGPAAGLALELGPKNSLLVTPMPFTWDSFVSVKKVPEAAPGKKTAAPAPLPTRERFLQFATRPLFPRLPFGPQDRLKPCTRDLEVEHIDGQWFVSTPVGLGMSDPAARAWLASMSDTLLTNLDLLEFSYRATLVPQESGGPGLTFAEAQQTAVRLALTGKKWSQPKAVLGSEPGQPARTGALRAPVEGGRIGAIANECMDGLMGLFSAFPPSGYWEGHGHHHGSHHGGHGSGHHGCHPR
jgi:hypothetical protein